MKNVIYSKKKTCVILIIVIFTLNLFSIIQFPSNFIKTDKSHDSIEKWLPFIHTSSTGPPNCNYFKYYKEITINHSKVSGSSDLINFPVLFSLVDLDLHNEVQEDGDDIAFSNGTIWLDHEIELFNQNFNTTHAKLLVWVRIPSLSPSIGTNITMYYGNSTMGPQENPENVWDSNFKGVWHLSENPSDSPPQMKDSTSNNNNGTTNNLDTSDQEDGQIDGSIDFDDNQDHIDCGNDTSLNMGSGEFSLSMWFNYDGIDWGAIAGKGAVLQGKRYYLSFNTPAGQIRAEIDDDSAPVNPNIISGANYGDNKWHHLVMVRDEDYLRLYLDGNEDGTRSVAGYGNIDSIHPFYMNAICGDNSGQITSWSSVKLDEVRVSNTARSVEWIETEYNNQYNPNSFYTVSEAMEVNPLSVDDFEYYKEITIDHNQVSGSSDLINFPLLVSLFDSDLHNHAQPDGDDIVFYNGSEFLTHEIEVFNQTFNSTHAQLAAWVRIPSLSFTTDTTIFMYYGNSAMESCENATNVWNDNYRGVWHLNEISGNALDSTDYDVEGIISGDTIQGTDGKIDGSYEFDGDSDEVAVGDPIDGHLNFGTNSFTVSFWVKFFGSTSDYQLPIYKGGNMDTNAGYEFETNQAGTSLDYQISDGIAQCKSPQIVVDINQWSYIVGVVDRSADTQKIYKNGTQIGSATDISSLGSVDNSYDLLFSWDWYSIYGKLDEVRISSTVRSADWIATEYNNQHYPNLFYSIGEEDTTLKPESFQYYKEIIIDHTKVSGSSDLLNFPILISLFDSDLQDHTQEDGDDIVFYYGNGWLDHELELFDKFYNGTHAQLVAWVRIPSLSTTTDTKITMYYGNSTIESQENPTGVWDENYCFVLHMNQDPSSSDILDSTSNGFDFDVEVSGSMTSNDLVNGQTGKAIAFDGEDDYIYLPIAEEFTGSTEKFTFEFWLMFPDGWSPSSRVYLGAPATSDANPRLAFYDTFEWEIETTSDTNTLDSTQTLFNSETWYQFATVWDGTGAGLQRIYISGSLESDDPSPLTGTHISWNTFSIGAEDDDANGPGGSGSDREIKATISEFRLSKVVRSADWIATEYNNQKNPHSFYSVSSEKTPDSSPPTYTNLIESSDPLELGDTEIISINVSDPSGINQVKIEFSGTNHSMNNTGGDTWQYDSWTPSSVGNYSYTIWMEDNYNNWNSTLGSIEVIDTTPPTYSNLIESADPLQLGQNETISIKVYDSPGSGVNQVLLEYESFNHTMNFAGGNTWNWSNWKPISGGVYPYKIYMQDMENNWNTTTGSITVISSTAPFIENLTKSADPLELGENITINVDVYDIETWVSSVLLELGGANYTMINNTSNTYYIRFVFGYNWTPSLVGIVNYKIYANDTDNNWNSLSDNFEIIDTTSPNFDVLTEGEDPLEFGKNEIISINCTDLTGINKVLIEYEDSYHIISNHTMTNVAGDTWQYSIWTPSSTGIHFYRIWIEDNNNNWNDTIGSILVQDTTPPIYSDLTESADPVELGTPLVITIITTDLSDIDQVLIEFEGSNHSMEYFGGDSWQYEYWQPNKIGNYSYTIYMRDNHNNWNFTMDSITFQDTIVPIYKDLIETTDPLELGTPLNIKITVNDVAGINQTLFEFEGSNHSMIKTGIDLWEYDSWTPDNWIVYQYKIHMEDKSGNWNVLIDNITVQDTTDPSPPALTNSPSGDVSGTLLFDWADGFDYSGISYYILIIDNETNPSATPGYVYFANITNVGSESSYCELPYLLPPGRYYYFLYQIDGVGHQSSSTIGTFTVVSNDPGNPPANDTLIFIIIGIILAIIMGSIVSIIVVKKRVQKKVIPQLKKIPIKTILQHIDKISILQTISKPDEILKDKVEITPWKTEQVKDLGNLDQIELDLMEIKTLGEELFNEGAYLEAQKQFEIAKNMLLDSGLNEEAKLFSELIEGIKGLTDKRENLLKILERVEIEGNTMKIFEIYYDLIQISKKLRDSDAVDMYQSEFIQIFQSDNLKLLELEDYRAILEEQIKSLLIENNFEMVAEFYEKCEMISEFLIILGREEEKLNVEKFRNKKNEYLRKK